MVGPKVFQHSIVETITLSPSACLMGILVLFVTPGGGDGHQGAPRPGTPIKSLKMPGWSSHSSLPQMGAVRENTGQPSRASPPPAAQDIEVKSGPQAPCSP
ncbi:hypothetical protein CRENBAI_026594 [Crenichthys baileyi]|uniref:Uncharacterized protein n=1 Tax=Crenichthys baileyi TaxID=28760 RepID=A0AAV9RWK2_9TELE